MWMDYLRAERMRKLESISLLSSDGDGRVTISRTTGGVRTELNDEIVAKHYVDIAEIEKILTESGEPLDI